MRKRYNRGMAEVENYQGMDEKPDDGLSKAIGEAVRLLSQQLQREFFAAPASERAAIVERMNSLWGSWRQESGRQREMLEFVYRLATRQGTVMPDFEALYQKKAELDRRISEHEE
jgi:hypothetical protein